MRDAIDTNVLLRFLVDDEGAPEQCRRAVALVKRHRQAARELFVSDVVVAELVWAFNAIRPSPPTKSQRADVLLDLLASEVFVFQDTARLRAAVRRWQKGSADFADYLIGELARDAQAKRVFTFDAKLAKEEGFARP